MIIKKSENIKKRVYSLMVATVLTFVTIGTVTAYDFGYRLGNDSPSEEILQNENANKVLYIKEETPSVITKCVVEEIPIGTIYVEDEDLYQGQEVVLTQGLSGKKCVEYKITTDGEVSEAVATVETLISDMEERVIKVGTKPLPKGVATGSFLNPASGVFSSPFGKRWGRMHKGIDVAAPVGTPIYASDGGKVIYADWMSGYGYLVQVDHKNGYVTYYAHCSALLVNVGDEVAKGEQIAEMGSTGNSTGSHLHFEVRLDNVPHDPLNYVNY